VVVECGDIGCDGGRVVFSLDGVAMGGGNAGCDGGEVVFSFVGVVVEGGDID